MLMVFFFMGRNKNSSGYLISRTKMWSLQYDGNAKVPPWYFTAYSKELLYPILGNFYFVCAYSQQQAQ